MDLTNLSSALVVCSLIGPCLTFLIIGFGLLISRKLSELRVNQLCAWTFGFSFVAAFIVLVALLTGLVEEHEVDLGAVIALRSYHLNIQLLIDRLGILFLTINFMLCGLVGAFSTRYMHREEGFQRFYLQLTLFCIGVALIALGNGLDLIFAGWEIVGITSALLIGFYYQREYPVRNGLRTYGIYRITDVGLLFAVVFLHHFSHGHGFQGLEHLPISGTQRLVLGLALVFGAMGKGALFPLTSWLPRAMEGPTPSSAIFYGALSVHASPFLLLRMFPVLEPSMTLRIIIALIGLITAIHATMVGRAQNDIKSSLGYASATQIGLIWFEIACGFTTLAIVHFVGHAILRTWQLLRAPSLLQERGELVLSKGALLDSTGRHLEQRIPLELRRKLYRWSIERWYLEEIAKNWIGSPLSRILGFVNWLDVSWTEALSVSEAESSDIEMKESVK